MKTNEKAGIADWRHGRPCVFEAAAGMDGLSHRPGSCPPWQRCQGLCCARHDPFDPPAQARCHRIPACCQTVRAGARALYADSGRPRNRAGRRCLRIAGGGCRNPGTRTRLCGPVGDVRVAAASIIIECLLPGVLAQFRLAFPDVRIELIASREHVSLSRREADVAIRITDQLPDWLIGRKLADLEFKIYAPATGAGKSTAPPDRGVGRGSGAG